MTARSREVSPGKEAACTARSSSRSCTRATAAGSGGWARVVEAEDQLLGELGEARALPSTRLGGVEVQLARGVVRILRRRGRGGGSVVAAGGCLIRGRPERDRAAAGTRATMDARRRGARTFARAYSSPVACATEKRSLEPAAERFIATGEAVDLVPLVMRSDSSRTRPRASGKIPLDDGSGGLALASTRGRRCRGRADACSRGEALRVGRASYWRRARFLKIFPSQSSQRASTDIILVRTQSETSKMKTAFAPYHSRRRASRFLPVRTARPRLVTFRTRRTRPPPPPPSRRSTPSPRTRTATSSTTKTRRESPRANTASRVSRDAQ